MIDNYFKLAWRNLLKNKGFGLINISGLAIGMTVAVLIGLWLHDELTFDHYHGRHNRLAQVNIHQTFDGKTGTGNAVVQPLVGELRTNFSQDFNNLAMASWSWDHQLAYGERRIQKEGMYVEPAFPRMFSLKMIAGSVDKALTSPTSILLSDSIARALFDGEDPMGKTLRLDQKTDVQVAGVFEDLPANSSFHATRMFLPWAIHEAEDWVKNSRTNWGNHSWQLFAEVNDPEAFERISDKIKGVELAHNKDGNPVLFLQPMDRWHLYSEFKEGKNVGGRIQYVWLFGIIGLFVLLLACINFMNLSTARSEKRAREVGVRKTVGSMRGQLVFQFLTESLLTVLLALALALLLVQLFLPGFNQLADKKIVFPLTAPLFWAALGVFTVATAVLAGSYPAFYLSSFQPLKVLKGTFRTGRSGSLPRKILVVAQFTVSVTLIIGTLVVFQQIQHAKNRPVGYDRAGLLQTGIGPDMEKHYEALRQDLLASGAVREMSASSSPVTDIYSNQIGFDWDGKDPNSLPIFGIVGCSYDFGKSIGWQILEGRDFSRAFATDTAGLILNESAVRLTGLQNIVGKTIRQDKHAFQVVGVVKDMIMESPYTPVKPTIFRMEKHFLSVYNLRLTPGLPVQDALARVQGVFKKFDPDSPFEFKFADEEYEAKFRSEERIGKLARLLAGLAIFISCLGLFGLSAYVVEQRTKEIGIRKVLGASVSNLWAMLSKDFLLLVLIACLLAVPLAWYYLDGWLADYEYRITLQWWYFALAGVLAVLVTLCTVSFQSIRAALANPVQSLRSE